MSRLALVLATLLSVHALAQEPPKPAPPPPPAAKITDVAWLQGYWVGEGMGGVVEDVWLPPKDGVLLGAFRIVKTDGKGFYEIFAIEEHEGSLRFVVKHFNPDWVGWEEKDKYVSARLSEIGPGRAVFGGIIFERVDAENLTVSLTLRRKDGTKVETLKYKRKPL